MSTAYIGELLNSVTSALRPVFLSQFVHGSVGRIARKYASRVIMVKGQSASNADCDRDEHPRLFFSPGYRPALTPFITARKKY